MCSFLILLTELYKKHNLKELNKLLKTRGPDNTNIYNYDKYTFIHNILHLCGSLTIQPIVKENIIVLFIHPVRIFCKSPSVFIAAYMVPCIINRATVVIPTMIE